jgi:multicomponent Na+:H+ antiporter subunit G
MNDLIFKILLVTGVMFNLFGSIGLVRLPDVYNRLQAATKCVTLGTCSIMIALAVKYGFSEAGVKAIVAVPLLFFTSTVAAHALFRGAYHFGIKLYDRSVLDEYRKLKSSENEISENQGNR